jgi:site-specific recombinase XerD
MIVNYKNEQIHNAALRKIISDLDAKITRMILDGIPLSIRLIRDQDAQATGFRRFAQEIRDNQKEINRLETYAGKNLLLSDITSTFLRKYESHERRRGMSQNTINLTFKYLRRIIRQARAERLIKENPFDDYRVPRYVQSDRIYLIESETKKLMKLLEKGNINASLRSTLIWFLLGCYTGLRHSDWLRYEPKMVDGSFLRLRAKKNGKWVVMPIGNTLRELLALVRDLPRPISGQKFNVQLKAIAGMAKVDKPITSHSARHTFATMCATHKIPQSVTAELLGVDTKTVRVYYHLTGSAIEDQAAILKTI